MIIKDLLDTPDLSASKVATMGKTERLQPELCHAVLTFHVYVRRFATIARVEEYAIGALLQNSRHSPRFSRSCYRLSVAVAP